MNKFELFISSTKEKVLRFPVIRSLAKKTLEGNGNDERYLQGWSTRGSFTPDAVAGYSQRAVSVEDQTRQLEGMRGGKTPGQIEVKEEEHELNKEGRRGKLKAVAIGAVAIGVLGCCMFTALGSIPGQANGDIIRTRIEITSGDKAHLGERKVYNSLASDPEIAIYAGRGTTGIIDRYDFFQDPQYKDLPEAKDYDAEVVGMKTAFKLLINQDAAALTKKYNDQVLTEPSGVVDYLKYTRNNNSPKTLDSLISYFKSKETNNKKDRLYWDLLKAKIEAFIK